MSELTEGKLFGEENRDQCQGEEGRRDKVEK